ncbi:hypothetical protein K8S19_04550 [bacterium]|nr:hypothetical protein [bacterium]
MSPKKPLNDPKRNSQKTLLQIRRSPVFGRKKGNPGLYAMDEFPSRIARIIMHACSVKSPEAKKALYEKAICVIGKAKKLLSLSTLPGSSPATLLQDLTALESQLKTTIALLSGKCEL